MVEFLEDNSRNVRRNAARSLGNHGNKNHLNDLDGLLARDPILSRDVRLAKKKIISPSMRTEKIRDIIDIDELLIDPDSYLSQLEKVLLHENSGEIKKELQEANKRLEEIRRMLK